MRNSQRLVVLAMDGANPFLLRSWADDGTLPNIRRLIETGFVADTESVDAFLAATWPSFYTGCNPASHGVYWLDRLELGTYRVRPGRPEDFSREPALWDVVSEAGRRVLVLDVPMTRLSPTIRGAQILEWGVHDAAFGFQTSPPELSQTILDSVGPYPIPPLCDADHRTLEEYRDFTRRLEEGAAARARLTRNLLATEAWDLAIQVFSECHCGGHQLWHFHDSSFPGHPGGGPEEDLLRRVYIAVDRAIGEIVEAVGPDTRIALMTLHGMSYACGSGPLLKEILIRLGVMTTDSDSTPAGAASPRDAMALRARAAYRRMVPEGVRRRLFALRQHVGERALGVGTRIDLDPARSKAFNIDMGIGSTCTGIRLNLAGREPAGILRPEEVDDFCGALAADLLEIVDPATGRPLVRSVDRTGELYQGARLDELPDLIVRWNRERRMSTTAVDVDEEEATWRAASPRIGSIERVNTYCRTGDHRIEGLVVVAGGGIAPGSLDRPISSLDLAPTFAHWLGCEMESADGTPVPELAAL